MPQYSERGYSQRAERYHWGRQVLEPKRLELTETDLAPAAQPERILGLRSEELQAHQTSSENMRLSWILC